MLGLYTNSNNMYVNQNYGYGQSTYNPYQQQSSLFSGYSTGYANNYTNGYTNNYSSGYGQQNSNMSSMLLSILSALLPSLLGMFGNTQAVQQPYATNNANYGQNNIFNSLLGSMFGGTQAVQQPYTTNNASTVINGNSGQNNIYNTIINLILNSDKAGKTPLEVYNEDVTVQATGDPHFAVNGQQAFDFQGQNDGMYKMLDNSDISLNAKFAGGGEGTPTIIKDQNLSFKDSDINVVSHANGNFEILQNGEKIADQTNYNTDKEVIDLLKENDITITKEGNILTTKHAGRTLEQRLNGGNIDNTNDTLMKGDEGLLTQGIGAIDDDKDGTTKMSVDVNKDGVVDDKDTLTYSAKDQFMVHTECAASSCATITPEIEEAIKKDIAAGAKLGSVAKGFSADHGYDARQWNEYIGAKLYTVKEDELLTAKKDTFEIA